MTEDPRRSRPPAREVALGAVRGVLGVQREHEGVAVAQQRADAQHRLEAAEQAAVQQRLPDLF